MVWNPSGHVFLLIDTPNSILWAQQLLPCPLPAGACFFKYQQSNPVVGVYVVLCCETVEMSEQLQNIWKGEMRWATVHMPTPSSKECLARLNEQLSTHSDQQPMDALHDRLDLEPLVVCAQLVEASERSILMVDTIARLGATSSALPFLAECLKLARAASEAESTPFGYKQLISCLLRHLEAEGGKASARRVALGLVSGVV